MGRRGTAGTKQLMADVDAGLRDRLAERVKAEQRSLRAVVERALTYYMANVPVNGLGDVATPDPPKRGRPRKKK
jgi:hypothetical protein